MKLIKGEKIGTPVNDQQVWNFDVPENGAYVILISASCKNWLQNYKHLFNDDDLALQIDDYLFAEIKGKMREFASYGSWNGNEIKSETKDVLFILSLKAGSHKIKFWVGEQPILEEIKIYKIDESEIDLIKNVVSPNNFFDVIFKNIIVKKLEIKAKAKIGSNLEIKVDGKREENSKYKRFAKWYWYGQELKGRSKEYNISNCLNDELHSVEFHGYGSPEIESIKLKIDLDNIVYSHGFVKLYKDIVPNESVNLRLGSTDESESLMMLQDAEKVNILNEQVVGKYIKDKSNIWHEVIVHNTRGYVLSSFIEIEGQEREKIIDLIKERCNQYSVDANIMLAIASRESHFKPFARSFGGARGVFQLFEDAMKDVEIADAYDFYQNIDGGVRYYKKIEKRVTGRGDILIKRLVAWHDGPTITVAKIKNKTFDYNKLSDETKSFVKNVQANLEKKDWYHIIYLPIIILFFVSFHLFWKALPPRQIVIQNQTADVINSSVPITYLGDSEKIVHYFSEINKNRGISFSSVFDDVKDWSEDYYSYSPNVFWDKVSNQVIFLNLEKKVAGKIDPKLLNTDKILGVDPVDSFDHVSIGSVVLENPKDFFYFSAINSYGCGASNCHFALYRFDAQKKDLKLIDAEIFGQIMGLYLSPDLNHLAVVSGSTGGVCNNNENLNIFSTATFSKLTANGFYDEKYSSQILENFTWKNNNEMQFDLNYFKCAELDYVKATWLHNIHDTVIKKVDSKVVHQDL